MKNSFDDLAKNLQQKIDADEEKVYSKTVIQEYRNPDHYGKLPNPDATAQFTGPCGDTMRTFLKIAADTIIKARFQTDGCGPSLACGNMLMKLVEGKNVQDAYLVTNRDLLTTLNGLPQDHQHCAKLAVDTLQKALTTYLNQLKQK